MNQRWRCAEEPWVKLSGTTRPVALRCKVSSPIAEAVCIAASMSPGSTSNGFPWLCNLLFSRFAQTPAKQSACSSTLTCKPIGLGAIHPLLLLLDPGKNSQRILHVMADLVGDHIGL